jgi:hypothetical protein
VAYLDIAHLFVPLVSHAAMLHDQYERQVVVEVKVGRPNPVAV